MKHASYYTKHIHCGKSGTAFYFKPFIIVLSNCFREHELNVHICYMLSPLHLLSVCL